VAQLKFAHGNILMPFKDFDKELIACQERASQCEAEAQSTTDVQVRKDLLRSRDAWFRRARGYEVAQKFLESLPPSQSNSRRRPGH
jgi:hypothetical protein